MLLLLLVSAFTILLPLAVCQDEIVFLLRKDGSENFYRGWDDYKAGFGDPDREFWLGLDELNTLTSNPTKYKLRVEMLTWSGDFLWAEYGFFSVGSEDDNYPLTVAGYNPDSTAGDSLMFNTQLPFSTYDNENTAECWLSCAKERHGAWWYRQCTYANPTGQYLPDRSRSRRGVTWYHAGTYNSWQSFKEMMFTMIEK